MNFLFKVRRTSLGVLWAAFIAVVPVTSEGANLVSIIVADTLDFSIGHSVAVDFDKMRQEVQMIAHYTDLDLKEVTLRGWDVRPANFLEALRKLEIQPDDVVIFYFSGHGYRTLSKGMNPWPNLYFSCLDQGVAYDFVGKTLKKQKPRFILLIADVCNSLLPEEWAPPLKQKIFWKPTNEPILRENYRHLFLDTTGFVMVTSSEAGEPSWDTGFGGLFTRAFLESLKEGVQSSNMPEWRDLLDKSAMKIHMENQHPYYELHEDFDNAISGG